MPRKKFIPPKVPTLLDILGKKVVAMKGFRSDMRKKKGFEAIYILFNDGKTYIELEDQDYYTYHDCNSFAKVIKTFENPKTWKFMMENGKNYPDADKDPSWY